MELSTKKAGFVIHSNAIKAREFVTQVYDMLEPDYMYGAINWIDENLNNAWTKEFNKLEIGWDYANKSGDYAELGIIADKFLVNCKGYLETFSDKIKKEKNITTIESISMDIVAKKTREAHLTEIQNGKK